MSAYGQPLVISAAQTHAPVASFVTGAAGGAVIAATRLRRTAAEVAVDRGRPLWWKAASGAFTWIGAGSLTYGAAKIAVDVFILGH